MQQFSPLAAMMHVQQQGEMGKQRGEQSRLARLVSQGMSSPGGLRAIAPEVASFNPEAAFALEDRGAAQIEQRRKLLSDRARLLSAMPVQQRAQAWPSMRAELAQLDPELGTLPEQYDDAQFGPVIQQLAGMDGGQSRVQRSFVGEDGQMYALMSDGQVQPLGVGADRRTQFVDVPGVGPQIIDLRQGSAQTVTAGSGPRREFSVTPGEIPFPTDPAEAEAARRAMTEGGTFRVEGGRVMPGQSGMQPAANRTIADTPINQYGGGPVGAPAWVRPASGGRGDAGAVNQLSPQEVAQLGLPEGTVAQRGPDGKVTTIFTPDAGQRKAAREAKQKLPRVDAAMRRVDRLAGAIETIAGGFFDGGPIDQRVLQYSPEGQEVVQAAASLLPELTALTRVPGVGSQSDLETRLANLQLPSLEFPPEVNRRALSELRTFMADLSEVYRGMAGGDGSSQPVQQPEETDDDALIGKYL